MKKAIKQSKLFFRLNLLSGVLLLIVVLLLSGTMATSKKADTENENRAQLSDYATRFMATSSFLTGEVRAYAATGDIAHYNNYQLEITESKTREYCMKQMQAYGITAEQQNLLDKMLNFSNSLLPQEEDAMQLAEEGDHLNAAKAVLTSPYNNTVTDIYNTKLEFLDQLDSDTKETVNQLVLATRFMEVVTFLAVLGVILLQFISYRIIRSKMILPIIAVEAEARRIAAGQISAHFELEPDTSEIGMLIDSMQFTKMELQKYVSDISSKLSQMAARNLSVNVDIDYIGDFAPIKESMREIVIALNKTFYSFDNAADMVASTSVQVSSESVALAEGSQQQAASIQEISSSMTHIAEQINHTAEQSHMATELANAAGIELSKSNDQLQGMLQAMTDISDASDEIGRVIKTIEDIAFQTNILALNAAVEAARAGEAGKGFAVVAAEVRNLAIKSAEASETTAEMIENSLDTIQNGAKTARSASSTFVNVMVNAGRAAEAMASIYKATGNQVLAITQINAGMEQIASVVQHNSSASEETATTSEDLARQADELRDQVHQFQLHPKVKQATGGGRYGNSN